LAELDPIAGSFGMQEFEQMSEVEYRQSSLLSKAVIHICAAFREETR